MRDGEVDLETESEGSAVLDADAGLVIHVGVQLSVDSTADRLDFVKQAFGVPPTWEWAVHDMIERAEKNDQRHAHSWCRLGGADEWPYRSNGIGMF